MTLRHMKIYLMVYQKENITKAAELLHMTQPAVTRAVQEMEQYYGIQLFERLNRRLYKTEVGKVFYEYALHIVDSFEQMEKSIRNWDELGIIRVGTSITIGNTLLPEVLSRFRKEFPDLRIQSTITNGANLQQALLENTLDFAVIEGEIEDERLCKDIIAKDKLMFIMPPDDIRVNKDTLLLKDLLQDDFLLREKGSAGRTFTDHIFAVHGIAINPVMESVSTQAIVQAVHKGLGISFLPERLVRPYIDSGFVATRIIDDESFERKNYLVWHRQKFLTKMAKEIMEYFRKLAKEEIIE